LICLGRSILVIPFVDSDKLLLNTALGDLESTKTNLNGILEVILDLTKKDGLAVEIVCTTLVSGTSSSTDLPDNSWRQSERELPPIERLCSAFWAFFPEEI
jgi:hypothetical protein